VSPSGMPGGTGISTGKMPACPDIGRTERALTTMSPIRTSGGAALGRSPSP
jgi:hypothetical protein